MVELPRFRVLLPMGQELNMPHFIVFPLVLRVPSEKVTFPHIGKIMSESRFHSPVPLNSSWLKLIPTVEKSTVFPGSEATKRSWPEKLAVIAGDKVIDP